MGGCISSASVDDDHYAGVSSTSEGAARTPPPRNKRAGQRLGGDADVAHQLSAREAAAQAAEARAAASASQSERAARQELVGRITELYKRRGQEPPFALGGLPVARLRTMLDDLKKQPTSAA